MIWSFAVKWRESRLAAYANDGNFISIQRHCTRAYFLSNKSDGKCVICDSYVRPAELVKICDECNYGRQQGRCIICSGVGISDAYYCRECVLQEKDVFPFNYYYDI